MKRIVSLALSIALCFSVLTVSASAAPKSDNSRVKETFTMKGREASSAMREMIEEEGITVTEDTVIQLVPLSSAQRSNSENSGNALVITNQEGTTVRQDSLLLVTDDGIGFADMNEVMARSSFPYDNTFDKILVHGVAYYDKYTDINFFYRPLKAEFYYRKYQPCDVSSIGFCYECSGGVHTYPELRPTNQSVNYAIKINQTNPVVMRTYSKERAYPSNRVICTSAGGGPGGAGNTLTYIIVIDGRTYDDIISFNDNE